MLLSIEKMGDFKYVLKCSFEGKRYEDALANYPSYIQDLFRNSYENELFPKGKTPIVVNEQLHGDSLYRKILEGNFTELYYEAVEEAKISNAYLENVEIDYFSRERIVFKVTVSSDQNISADKNDPVAVLNEEFFNRISNVDKLVINSTEKRDEFFWRDLQDICVTDQERMSQELTPLLSKIGVLNYDGNAVQININDSDPFRSFYPLVEMTLYPCAVLAAALHEYIPDFSKEDEYNLKK